MGMAAIPGLTTPAAALARRHKPLGVFAPSEYQAREDLRRAVDNFRKVSWGRNPCSRRACPEAARVRDPAKVPGRMGKDGQKKKPILTDQLLHLAHGHPEGRSA